MYYCILKNRKGGNGRNTESREKMNEKVKRKFMKIYKKIPL